MSKELEIQTNLPQSVKEFTYVRNCHYIRLKDRKGSEIVLTEHGVIAHTCKACDYVWWASTNAAKTCPACTSTSLSYKWLRPQIALIPEEESDFEMPPRDDKHE